MTEKKCPDIERTEYTCKDRTQCWEPCGELGKSEEHARVYTPEQEPVAWLQIGIGPLHEGDVIARTTKPKEWNPEWWKFEPLYTTPPQRKPLTDERVLLNAHNIDPGDWNDLRFRDAWHEGFKEGARSTEADHGIKE